MAHGSFRQKNCLVLYARSICRIFFCYKRMSVGCGKFRFFVQFHHFIGDSFAELIVSNSDHHDVVRQARAAKFAGFYARGMDMIKADLFSIIC